MQGLLELSKEQLQDFEVLRRIYLIRRAGLAKERKMLMHQAVRSLSHAEDTVPLPGHTRVSSPECQWCFVYLSSVASQSSDNTEVFMLVYSLLQCCNARTLPSCCPDATRLFALHGYLCQSCGIWSQVACFLRKGCSTAVVQHAAVQPYKRMYCCWVQVASLAARLQEIAQEDYRVYHRIAAAARRGVCISPCMT